MTRGHDAVDDLPEDLLPEHGGPGVFLHSFGVMARFRTPAADAPEAERQVRERLQVVRGLYDDTRVEPQEPDGRWAVDVRFVVASLDGETAVEGVHATLREQGLVPDEAWLAEQLP
jgi:hypothetical protein